MKGKNKHYKRAVIASICAISVIGIVLFSMAIRENPAGGLRRDVEPIQKRFPEIENIESVAWLVDSFGRATIGLNPFWIEGYIELKTPLSGGKIIDDWVLVDDFEPRHLSDHIEKSDDDWFHSDTFDDEYGGEIMFLTTVYRSSDELTLYVYSESC